jgi:mRNA-degrading endonuclease RelE of RelBE toxin-antitoxin system
MPYIVYATDTFRKLFKTLDGTEQQWIAKIKVQLEENPTGKPLRFDWFREKKFLNKRLFFLIDESTKKILFVSFASKTDQQEVIDFVIANKDELFSYLRSL